MEIYLLVISLIFLAVFCSPIIAYKNDIFRKWRHIVRGIFAGLSHFFWFFYDQDVKITSLPSFFMQVFQVEPEVGEVYMFMGLLFLGSIFSLFLVAFVSWMMGFLIEKYRGP